MRQITADAYYAFCHKKRFRKSNTEVAIINGEAHLYLFGNEIARTDDGRVLISSAGYVTSTTRERLNAFRVRLRIAKGKFILNECMQWDGKWINVGDTYV